MPIDSFKYVPRAMAAKTRDDASAVTKIDPVPFTPLRKPVRECRFALVTSAGIRLRTDPRFDVEREIREPTWGDPTYRVLPRTVRQDEIAADHLHTNNDILLTDVNTVFPIHRMNELAEAGEIGSLAESHYSFMGYQGEPPQLAPWREQYGPEVTDRMKQEGVDAVLLTPS